MEVYIITDLETGQILGVYNDTTNILECVIHYFIKNGHDKQTIANFACDWDEFDVECLEDYGFVYHAMYMNDYFKAVIC